MKKRHDDSAYLLDILQATRLSLEFIKNMTLESFIKDLKTQSAVIHQIMVMGEAVKKLSAEFKTAHSDFPWKQMAGTRDVLIHNYNEADPERIWKILQDSLPDLVKKLGNLVHVNKNN